MSGCDQIDGAELLNFQCSGCTTCCKLYVPVTDADVRRLMDATNQPARRIVTFVGTDEIIDQNDDLFWVRVGRKGRKTMVLRQKRDACQFLEDGRCSVYEFRPGACREYPLDVTVDDDEKELLGLDISSACECSHTLDGEMCPDRIVHLYRWTQRECDEFDKRVDHWNDTTRKASAGTRTERRFFEHIGLVEAPATAAGG